MIRSLTLSSSALLSHRQEQRASVFLGAPHNPQIVLTITISQTEVVHCDAARDWLLQFLYETNLITIR